MKQTAIFITLAAASMAGRYLKSGVDSLSWPALTGVAILMFSGLFIFTVMSVKSPAPLQWKLSILLTDSQKEHLNNVVQLMGVMFLIAATAVTLIAIAEGGLGEIPEVLKALVRMLDV